MERDSLSGCMFAHFCQGFQSAKHWRVTHCLDGCLLIFVSGSNPLKCNSQAGWPPILISGWSTQILPVKSNSLARCVFIHFCQWSDLLKCWRQLTCWICVHPFSSVTEIPLIHCKNSLPVCSPFSSVVPSLISNVGEKLTNWMSVHPFW